MFHRYVLSLLLTSLCFPIVASAQCSPTLAPDSAQYVTNGYVHCFQKKGNTLFLGGSFDYIGKPTGSFLGMNSAGKPIGQATWAKVWGVVNCAVQDGSGGWIIGGEFDKVGDLPRRNLVQLNSSGQVTSWNPGADEPVLTVAVSGSTVYAGGSFDSAGGTARNRIAAISLSTGLATTWNPNCNDIVRTMVVNGTTLYTGGDFTNIGGYGRNRVAAISTSTGVPTSWTPDVDGRVNCMIVRANKVYIGGSFYTVSTSYRNNIAILDRTTGNAMSWDANAGGEVKTMALGNNLVYFGGYFTSAGALTRYNAAAADTATGAISSWDPDVRYGRVNALATDGTIMYVCGSFSMVGGTSGTVATGFAKVNMSTGVLTGIQPLFPPPSYSEANPINVVVLSGANAYIGGDIYSFGGKIRGRLASIDVAADTITAFDPSPEAYVTCMLLNGNSLVIGGAFSYVGTTPRTCLAAFDSVGNLLPWAPYIGGGVTTMAKDGNSVFVGGSFSTMGSHHNAAKIDLTSGAFNSWTTTYANGVNAMAIAGDKLFIGRGSYYTMPNLSEYSTLTLAELPGVYTDFGVFSLYRFGSSVFVGGEFTTSTYGVGRLMALNASTGAATAWNAYVDGPVSEMAGSGNYLFIGGSFGHIGGILHPSLAAIKVGTASPLNTWTPAVSGNIGALDASNNELWVGGGYDKMDGKKYNNITRFKINNPTFSVAIAATGTSTVCAGATQTFTATPSIPVISYDWRVNGVSVGSGSTYSYVPLGGDQVKCVVVIDACSSVDSATSNTITMTVNPNINILTDVTPTQDTVCAGTSVTYTAHGIAGLHFQWVVNGTSVGPDLTSYTYTPLTGDVVECTVTAPAGGCYMANPVTSIPITMVVLPDTTPVITITGTTTLCAGTTNGYTLTSNIPGATYMWYVNTTSAGSGATSYSYTPVNGDLVKCVLTVPGTGCYTATHDTSNIITMIVNANVVPSTAITVDLNGGCAGKLRHYTVTTNVTSATYQWQVNSVNTGTGATTHNYTANNGDLVRCIVTTPSGSCYTRSRDTSNIITMSVIPNTMPVIIVNGPGTVAPGAAVTINATVMDAGSVYLITWYRNGVVFNTSSTPTASYAKDMSPIDTITAKVAALSTGCYDTGLSNTIYVYSTTGLEDVAGGTLITAFPNPFSEQITIRGLVQNDMIYVFDMLGRKVEEQKAANTNDMFVDVSRIIPGSYVLRVYDANGVTKANIPLQKK